MKRVIDLPDELAQSLDTYLLEHPEETLVSLVKEALENKLTSSETTPKEQLTSLSQAQKPCPPWEETLERIEARRKTIHARTDGKPFKPSITEIIHQMREERDKQLMQACFPKNE